MNKYNFYYRKKVSRIELNQLQSDIEAEVEAPIVDFYGSGILTGLNVSETSPQSFSVNITSGVIYDWQGKRVRTPSTLNLVCTNEGYTSIGTGGTCNGSVISLPSSGNKKYITILIYHAVYQSDYQIDGYGNPVYFRLTDSFRFRIIQGTEAPTPTPPADPGDGGIILADILLYNGMTVITNNDIITTRRNYLSTVVGRVRRIGDTMTGWLQFINSVGIRTRDAGGTYRDAFWMDDGNILNLFEGKLKIKSDGTIEIPGNLSVAGNINSTSGSIQQGGNAIVPVGALIIWKGSSCPAGYVRDDDFAGRFPLGAAVGQSPGDTGGSSTHTHTGTTDSGGAHSHGASTGYAGDHNHGASTGPSGAHSHGGSTGDAGGHSHGNTTAAGGHAHTIPTGAPHQHWIHVSDQSVAVKYWEGDESGHYAYPHISPLNAEYGSNERLGNLGYHSDPPTPEGLMYWKYVYRYTETDGSHSHSITSIGDHVHGTSSVSNHSHTITSVADHSHSITSQGTHLHSISSDSGHTHTFTTGTGSSMPPYRTVLFCRKV